MLEKQAEQALPRPFVWRRLHSLMGFWLTLYLIMHLFTNSQAALFFGDDGKGFIQAVNEIHKMPYLPLIEIAVLGLPIFIHMLWGLHYLFTASPNSYGNTGKTPYLPEYPRNHAYTWQRITSWLLVLGIIAHVIHMRVIEYPLSYHTGSETHYVVRISDDAGLEGLASRIGVKLYDGKNLPDEKKLWESIQERPLKSGEVVAIANNFGAVELLMVRDTFKMPLMIAIYTLFVLTACFHGFNGLWTFMISWGVTLSERSQLLMRRLTTALMVFVAGLGLAAIWFTYWINLRY